MTNVTLQVCWHDVKKLERSGVVGRRFLLAWVGTREATYVARANLRSFI